LQNSNKSIFNAVTTQSHNAIGNKQLSIGQNKQTNNYRIKTSASAGLQDANPTIRPYATGAPYSDCPPTQDTQSRLPQCDLCNSSSRRHPIPTAAHLGSNAAAVTPREPKFTKMGEDLRR